MPCPRCAPRRLNACPSCGAPPPAKPGGLGGALGALAAIGVVVWLVSVDKGDQKDDDQGRGGALARADRRTVATALFIENQFRAGRLRLTPGLRVELLHQAVKESLDLTIGSATSPAPGAQNGELGDKASLAAVVLPGIGAALDLGPVGELYGNFSRGYKPRLFNDGVTFQAGVNVAGTFEASYATVAEGGLRGRPTPWLSFDTSAFFLTYDNQIGLIGNDSGGAARRNLGPLQSYGWDALVELDPLALLGAVLEAHAPVRWRYLGNLNLFAGVSLLAAQYQRGPTVGNRPGYAPAYQLRTGAAFRYRERVKAALSGTIVADHSGVDNRHPLFAIPGYMVWDLSADIAVYQHYLGLTGGVNNLFDENYYARVRPGGGGGVDPAPRRNFYAGLFGRY